MMRVRHFVAIAVAGEAARLGVRLSFGFGRACAVRAAQARDAQAVAAGLAAGTAALLGRDQEQ